MFDLKQTINNWSFALFDLVRNSEDLEKITDDCEKIIQVLKQNKEYLMILNSYDMSDEKKYSMIDEAFGLFHPYILNTIKLATKKHVVKYLGSIFHRFIELSNEKLKIRYGKVFSSKKISTEEMKKLELKISKDLNSKIILVNEIDPSLIGGIKIKVDEYLIDNTVLGRLEKIKRTI
ncbi:F0F1 ATP synthase subunit delta [Mycoplasma enhydrae]|uniref:F0F1 ATP synthase subunit delta n=1 Tax=Mycoplasma enhydrae TaxID=2499220 RepID=UPI00197B9480|nr:F0F1 ATP synthase subunit delta [Mycoplasma enhydrae]MBN4089250.1 F0F1 ATP synthase subunit delta [Mycoplasma enhydrae]MCV3733590.1 F0F1 ATP synthase subunit delta [Mycoplasma enhydrae]